MFAAILSKTWWRSFVKGEGSEGEPADRENSEGEREAEEGSDDLDEIEQDASAEGADSESEEDQGDDEFEDEPFPEEEPVRQQAYRSKVDSPKDFFSTEVVYRFDILPDTDQKELRGSYRIEVKGNKGGVWTLLVGDQLEVVNRREEAEVVLSVQQRDFVQLVNGDLNPQMAILAQKMRFSGDVRRGILFQNLLAPPNQD